MRKLIQVAAVQHDPLKSGKTASCVTEILGLCDDGTLWVKYGALNTQGWVKVEGVPQGPGALPAMRNEAPKFSDRHVLILMAHAKGLSQEKTLAGLNISVELFKQEVASILTKLGVKTMDSAVTIARSAGFIPSTTIRQ